MKFIACTFIFSLQKLIYSKKINGHFLSLSVQYGQKINEDLFSAIGAIYIHSYIITMNFLTFKGCVSVISEKCHFYVESEEQ